MEEQGRESRPVLFSLMQEEKEAEHSSERGVWEDVRNI